MFCMRGIYTRDDQPFRKKSQKPNQPYDIFTYGNLNYFSLGPSK